MSKEVIIYKSPDGLSQFAVQLENETVCYWKELLDRIREIRSSEKVMYRQGLDLEHHSVRNVTLGKKQIPVKLHSVRNVTLDKKKQIPIKLHSVRNVTLGKKNKSQSNCIPLGM